MSQSLTSCDHCLPSHPLSHTSACQAHVTPTVSSVFNIFIESQKPGLSVNHTAAHSVLALSIG